MLKLADVFVKKDKINNKIRMSGLLGHLVLVLSFLFTAQMAWAEPTKKVLIVVSNMVDMGDKEKHDARNNLWEYAPPFHVFLTHGYDVDFVSPNGGDVEFMMDPVGISSYAIKYQGFLEKANKSLKPSEVKLEQYWGVYVGGGYGTLFDVAGNEGMAKLFREVYQAGGVIGSAGHGAGAFADVKLSTGKYMVANKRVAGFPNSTEKSKSWAKNGTLLPFLVESRLNRNGAFAQNKEILKDKHEVIIDQRLVSSMFLPSAALVAKEMIVLNESLHANRLVSAK